MLLLAALGCKEPVVTTIRGDDGALTLRLVNPTSCSVCDPFAGVDTLQLDVVQNGAVLATQRFAWPDAELTLPDLEGFGVVRVRLRGESGGEVVSFGQTPEIVLGPGETRESTLQFLPANLALPLTQPMVEGRRRHMGVSLRDGRALLVGGFGGPQGTALRSAEVYDPEEGSFTASELALPVGLADAAVATTLREGAVLFAGGAAAVEGGADIPSAEAVIFHEEEGTMAAIEPLGAARVGHCLSRVQDEKVLVLGGHTGTSSGDFVRWDTTVSDWVVGDVPFTDLDEPLVGGCAALVDHRTFVQGTTPESTGLWTFTAGGGADEPPMETAFLATTAADPGEGAAFVLGPSIVPLASGDAWVGGGIDPRTGALADSAREFRADTLRFDPADAQALPRVWGATRLLDTTGTVAWGCGWRDVARASEISSLDLFNVESGASIATVEFGEARSGCELTVLPDGAILVSGGGSATAEIVVPYWP